MAKTRTTPTPTTTGPQRKRRAVQYAVIFVGLVFGVNALVGEKGLLAMLKARQEYEQLAQSLAQARAQNADLREEARRLREDPAAIEEVARRELGLIRPGEKLFIVRDARPADAGRQ